MSSSSFASMAQAVEEAIVATLRETSTIDRQTAVRAFLNADADPTRKRTVGRAGDDRHLPLILVSCAPPAWDTSPDLLRLDARLECRTVASDDPTRAVIASLYAQVERFCIRLHLAARPTALKRTMAFLVQTLSAAGVTLGGALAAGGEPPYEEDGELVASSTLSLHIPARTVAVGDDDSPPEEE